MNKPMNIAKKGKLIAIGNSKGVILPKDIIAQLNLAEGDELSFSMTPDGVQIRPFDPEFEDQMATMRDVMKRRRNALRELAK